MKIALLALVLISSCRSSAESFIGPDGIQSYEIRCSSSMAKCYQKATKICKGGYEVINKEMVQDVSVSHGVLNTNVERFLTFRCK